MRIKETKVYQFAELSDKAKESAVNNMANINIDYEWWENTFYDAEHTALLKLTAFDTDRFCDGEFIEDAEETAKKIISEHGKNCDTLLTAREYMTDRNNLVKKYSDGKQIDIVTEDNEYDFDNDLDDLNSEFLKSILEDYRIILRKSYEYLSSEKAIIETIEANEYEFTEDGELS